MSFSQGRNNLIVLLSSLSCGLSSSLTSTTLQTKAASGHIELQTISLVRRIFKFLWAPFVDRSRQPCRQQAVLVGIEQTVSTDCLSCYHDNTPACTASFLL